MPFVLSHPEDTAERVEGEPFYQLASYALVNSASAQPQWRDFAFHVRAFKVLPPCDAVGLLSGNDSTGLVVWSGALALLEWLLREPERLNSIVPPDCSGQTAHVIELGCGSGIATVGLCALLRVQLRHLQTATTVARRDVVSCVHVWATDGNSECVELAQRNVEEQCQGSCDASCAMMASASLLPWGDVDATAEFVQATCGDVVSSSCITIISADVLYDAAAIPLLVSTVASIATACSGSDASSSGLQWWLAYTPRSLTRAGNERIYRTLIDSLDEKGWSHEVFPLPPGVVTTGFEERSDCDTPALRGCVLVVRVEAVPSPFSSAC